jgi:2-polyprenyl-3-methyl-5-hydroxy-6-metoxy-1,4-benzoquinol methylase
MSTEQDYFHANRELWNSRVGDHLRSEFYAVDKFRAGWNSLNAIERDLAGDVNGKSLLHLQCHFGMDTLSWERLGATVTGVDFSEKCIGAAKQLRDELGMKANFVCCNVYDTPQHVEDKFDIVFTSYGTITWLPDLERWAGVVSHFLKSGGFFLIAEFHPALWMLDEKLETLKYPYFNHEVIASAVTGSYAAREGESKGTEYGWNHSFGDLIGALLRHGLRLTHFEEYPFSPYNCFEGLEQRQDGLWQHPKYGTGLPMMYTLMAEK